MVIAHLINLLIIHEDCIGGDLVEVYNFLFQFPRTKQVKLIVLAINCIFVDNPSITNHMFIPVPEEK